LVALEAVVFAEPPKQPPAVRFAAGEPGYPIDPSVDGALLRGELLEGGQGTAFGGQERVNLGGAFVEEGARPARGAEIHQSAIEIEQNSPVHCKLPGLTRLTRRAARGAELLYTRIHNLQIGLSPAKNSHVSGHGR